MIIHLEVFDSQIIERQLIELFNKKFKNVSHYGHEYFEGSCDDIKTTLLTHVFKFNECTENNDKYRKEIQKLNNIINERNETIKQKDDWIQQQYKRIEDLKQNINQLRDNNHDTIEIDCSGTEHKNNEFKCSKCNKKFTRKDHMKIHEKKCEGLVDPKQCRICLKIFTSTSGKWKHTKNVKCKPPQLID